MDSMNKMAHTECSPYKAISGGHSEELTSAASLKDRMEKALDEARDAVKSMSFQHDRLLSTRPRLVTLLRSRAPSSVADRNGAFDGGKKVGIGLKFKTLEGGQHYVSSVLPGGVAAQSELVFRGDEILEVNGVAVAQLPPPEVVKCVLGAPGTPVRLLLRTQEGL